MRKENIIRFILDILIVAFLFGFVLSLLWYIHGSFEMFPTEEQQEKAQIVALLSMIVTGVPGIVCIVVRLRSRKGEK